MELPSRALLLKLILFCSMKHRFQVHNEGTPELLSVHTVALVSIMNMFKYIPFLAVLISTSLVTKQWAWPYLFLCCLLWFFSAWFWVKGEIPFLALLCTSPGTNPSLLFLSPFVLSKKTGFGTTPCSVLENFFSLKSVKGMFKTW